jgi:hypothetical protein
MHNPRVFKLIALPVFRNFTQRGKNCLKLIFALFQMPCILRDRINSTGVKVI